MHNKNTSQRLIGEVQMFRIRVAASESKLKVLREQARLAKRRRKEAKRFAQGARRQFKRSKAELAELRQALANAEAKFFRAGGRALARKLARLAPLTNRGARSSRKLPASNGKSPLVLSAVNGAPGRLTRRKSASKRISSSHGGTPGTSALAKDQSTTQNLEANGV